MTSLFLPANPDIQQVFVDSVQGLSGNLHDVFDNGHMLFMRATLPVSDLVQPNDLVRAGVALRVVDEEVTIYPYVLRQVCTNGAMLAHATDARSIQRADFAASHYQTAEILQEVREALVKCSKGVAFAEAVTQMRTALTVRREMDLVLSQVASLSSRGTIPARVLNVLLRQLCRQKQPTRYDLMNVVTAVARDVTDPQVRWRLEELGGGVLAPQAPAPRPQNPRNKAKANSRRAMSTVAGG